MAKIFKIETPGVVTLENSKSIINNLIDEVRELKSRLKEETNLKNNLYGFIASNGMAQKLEEYQSKKNMKDKDRHLDAIQSYVLMLP